MRKYSADGMGRFWAGNSLKIMSFFCAGKDEELLDAGRWKMGVLGGG